MNKHGWLTFSFGFLFAVIVVGAGSVGNGADVPTGALISPQIGTTAVQVKTGPGEFYGLSNVGLGLAVNATNCCDQVGGTTCTTQILPGSGVTLAAAGVSFTQAPEVGVRFSNGLLCITPTLATGGGPFALYL